MAEEPVDYDFDLRLPRSSPSRAFLALWDAARRRETFALAGVVYAPIPEAAALHARIRAILLVQVGFLSVLPAFSPQGADRCAADLTRAILAPTSPWHPLDGPW